MKKFVFSVASRAAGRLQIKPSGSGHENDAALEWEFSFPLPQYRHLFLYLFIIFIVWMVKHYDTKTEKPFLGGGGGFSIFILTLTSPWSFTTWTKISLAAVFGVVTRRSSIAWQLSAIHHDTPRSSVWSSKPYASRTHFLDAFIMFVSH